MKANSNVTDSELTADVQALRGFGFGVAGTIGDHEGASRAYVTDGGQRFFTYLTGTGAQPNVTNDGDTWRVTPQGYYYWGPFGVFGEYVNTDFEGGDANPALAQREHLVLTRAQFAF